MANHKVALGFHVEGAESFQKKTAAANKAIRDVNTEIRKLDATYGKGSKNGDYLTQKTELLTRKQEGLRQKTAALREELEAYRSSGKANAAELELRERRVRNSEIAEAELTRQIRECGTALRQTGDGLQQAVDGLQRFEKGAQQVGNALTRALTLPIAGMGTYALKTAMEFEDAMKTVQTLPGVTSGTAEEQAAQLQEYSEAILESSDATHTAAEALAAAQYSAISAGVAAEDSVYTVERSAKAAKAGLSDVETVVDGVTSALNAWQATAGGIDHVLDAMIVAQNEGKTTLGELASNIGQVTGLAPQLGVSLDELLASTAALTMGGVATSTAINGLKAVMSNVLKPTAEAREEAEKLGLEFSAAALQAKGLSGFLEDVMTRTNGDAESLGRLFGSVEALSEIMALGTTQAAAYERILGKIASADGAVDEAFAVRTSSRSEQLAGSLNKLRNAGIDLAEALLPAVDALAELAGKAADVVGSMDEGTQATLVNVLGIAAAAGPVIKGVGSLAGTGSQLLKLGGSLKTLLGGSTGLAAGTKTLATSITGSGGLLAGAKALLPVLGGALGLAAVTGGVTYGLIAAGDAVRNAGRDFSGLDATLANMDLAVNPEKLAAFTASIDKAIADAKETKQVTITATVNADTTSLNKEFTGLTATLSAEADAAMEDLKLKWEEYQQLTALLNQGMLPEAREGLKNPDTAGTAKELIGLIDDANALLREMYTSGDSVTAEEVAQFDELLARIAQYRNELTATADSTVSQYAVLTDLVNSAASDYRISEQEFEEIRRHLEDNVAPEAKEAVEDAATSAVATQLGGAMSELEALLGEIEASGGKVTEEQAARMKGLLAEIETCRSTISLIRSDTDSVYSDMSRSVTEALEDYRLTRDEYEAIRKQLEEEVEPDVKEAMEDAATSAVGAELDSALTELDELLAAIEQAGGTATQEQTTRINELLFQIQTCQAEIIRIRNDVFGVYAELDREVRAALSDYNVSKEEYEAIKKQLDTQVVPDVKEAMEDAATSAVAKQLDSALTELDELMASIQAAGGDATQEEIDRANSLLAQISDLQVQIAVLQGRTELLQSWDKELEESPEYKATTSGYGTVETAGKAAGEVAVLKEQKKTAIDQWESEQAKRYTETVVATESETERDEAKAAYEAQQKIAEDARQKADEDFYKQMQELFIGYAESSEANDEAAIAIEKAGKQLDLVLAIMNMNSEDAAYWLANERELRDRHGYDYDYVHRAMTTDDMLLVKVELLQLLSEWTQKQIDGLGEDLGNIDWDSTDLDEFYESLVAQGFDPNEVPDGKMKGLLSDFLRIRLLGQYGSFDDVPPEEILRLTYGDDWEQHDWTRTPEPQGPTGAQSEAGSPKTIREVAAEATQAVENAKEDALEAGGKLADSVVQGLADGQVAVQSAAQGLTATIAQALAGLTPVLPGTGTNGGGSPTPESTAGASSGPANVNNSINVGIQHANFSSSSGVRALADQLNTLNRMRNAGVGMLPR